jgi:hypothetical protein
MMDDTRGPPIQRYADVNRLMLKTFSQTCLDFKYTKLIKEMKNTDWDSSVGEGGNNLESIDADNRLWEYYPSTPYIRVFLRMYDQCRSRSACTFMPFDLVLNWWHLDQK